MAFFILKNSDFVLNTDLIKLIVDKKDYREIMYGSDDKSCQVIKTDLSVSELVSNINSANREFIGAGQNEKQSERYYEYLNEMNEFQSMTKRRLSQLELAFSDDKNHKLYDFSSSHHKRESEPIK